MNCLWYKESASDWNSALPVGNGRLGAMVYGRRGSEIIQLNEESIWSGSYRNRNNKSCRKELPNIRKLIREGRLGEAQELAYESMTGMPSQQTVYQTAGDFHLDFYTEQTRGLEGPLPDRKDAFKNYSLYKRQLDLDTAIASSSFLTETSMPSTADFSDNTRGSSINYSREVFVSENLDVIVIHISASTPKSIYFRAGFDRGNFCTAKKALSEDTIVMEDTHGIPYVAVATAVASGGTVCTRGEFLVVEAADEVTIYIDIETAFRNKKYSKKGGNYTGSQKALMDWCLARALEKVCFASCADYMEVRSTHMADYSALKETVNLNLTASDDSDFSMPTDELLAKKPDSAALTQLYWNFGRYLLISCSRKPGTLPANLQGLWNKDMDPPWGSKYTININTQMNYWGAAMCGLGETEDALFDLLARSYKNGVKTAREMYGVDGFVAHHNLDIWGDTAPQDQWIPGTYWVLGAAWLCTHVREHYEYTMDRKFLKKNFYLMKRACDFFAGYMVKADDSDYLVINPSVSPENTYRLPNGETGSFCAGTDMDNRILEHLFAATIQTAADLGVSKKDPDILRYKNILSRIEGVALTKEGTVREWPVKCIEVEPGHRHISQLYGLYPGHSINVHRTPEFAQAAKKTIEKRLANGGGHTGWSQAWIMNFWASLQENKLAYDSLVSLFKNSTLPNLFDNHPPFQIDGNFGSMCAITRMIVQSEMVDGRVEISLLPGLPEQWKDGSLCGVVLKGNIRLDIEWKEGRIERAELYTPHGKNYAEDLVVWYKDHRYEARLVDGRLDLLNVLPSTI